MTHYENLNFRKFHLIICDSKYQSTFNKVYYNTIRYFGQNMIKRASIFARQIWHSTWQKEVYETGQSLMVRAKFHNMDGINIERKKKREDARDMSKEYGEC